MKAFIQTYGTEASRLQTSCPTMQQGGLTHFLGFLKPFKDTLINLFMSVNPTSSGGWLISYHAAPQQHVVYRYRGYYTSPHSIPASILLPSSFTVSILITGCFRTPFRSFGVHVVSTTSRTAQHFPTWYNLPVLGLDWIELIDCWVHEAECLLVYVYIGVGCRWQYPF